MKHACAIFDLDGTLLDTLGDLKNAVNAALAARGHAERSLDEVRRFIGNGVANLISQAVPAGTSAREQAEILADFRRLYNAALNVETRPYDGILDLLKDLRAAGVKIAINSNKYDAAVQLLCKAHFSGLYDIAIGESDSMPKKPSPAAAQMLLRALNIRKEDAIYIGDSAVDLETAKNAGLPGAWVSWGFRRPEEMPEATLRFDSAEELSAYLLS